jgi:hypothetical protein
MSSPDDKAESSGGWSRAMVAGAVLVILIAVGGFAYILGKNGQRAGTLTLFYGDKKVAVMEIKEGNVALDKLLRDLFSDEGKERTFRALVRELRQYYQIQDPALVLGISDLKYEEPNARGLRQLYEEGKGPFAPQEFDARVGFASDKVIAVGRAAICPKNDMFRKELFVLGPGGRGAAVIRADLQGPCESEKSGKEGTPLLQIGFRDARRIFGCGPLLKEDRVHAVEKRFETPEAFDDPDCEHRGGREE